MSGHDVERDATSHDRPEPADRSDQKIPHLSVVEVTLHREQAIHDSIVTAERLDLRVTGPQNVDLLERCRRELAARMRQGLMRNVGTPIGHGPTMVGGDVSEKISSAAAEIQEIDRLATRFVEQAQHEIEPQFPILLVGPIRALRTIAVLSETSIIMFRNPAVGGICHSNCILRV